MLRVNKNNKGFTLIELLVVVAIVSLLSSIMFASLSSARAKGRDARRLSDIRQIRTALELYLDANGVYPISGGATQPGGGWSHSAEPVSWGVGSTFQTAIAPYMSRLPVDPTNNASTTAWITTAGAYSYSYIRLSGYSCSNRAYMLVYKLENGASVVSPGFTACDGTMFQYNGSGALNTTNANGIITTGYVGF